ncbi:hypothetical protein [Bradyrhizobium jicamae]|uniref:hypothetical protein n=1 Tax=Bradyrhizobium jicamae TaxID=280332 RepID=UPI001BAA5FBC|nr:hypothetical protein [Bradyrhizobium jicamae]MBR0936164.1 hypothetical protein [Bradyrhizobium jicamae]
MRLDNRTILIALVILNVAAIGLSEIQRRALVEHSLSSQREFRSEAGEWSKQQADALKKVSAELAAVEARVNAIQIELESGETTKNTAAQLAGIMARVNRVEIQTAESAAANKQITDIYNRVQEIQTTLRASK